MRFLTAIRFWRGMPIARIPHDWYATVSRRLDNIRIMNGDVVTDSNSILIIPETTGSSGMGGGSTDFNWYVSGTGLVIAVTPGAIEMGADTVIEWTDITGHTDTITLTTGTTVWWIWVNIFMPDGVPETAEMFNAASIVALTSEEKKSTVQRRIAKITLSGDVVTKIERAKCGNIDIPRL